MREKWEEIDLAGAGTAGFWLRQITLPRGIQPLGRDCERADIRKPARRTLIALARLRHAYQRSGVQLVVDVWLLAVHQRERHRWRSRAALLRRRARQRLPGDAKLVAPHDQEVTCRAPVSARAEHRIAHAARLLLHGARHAYARRRRSSEALEVIEPFWGKHQVHVAGHGRDAGEQDVADPKPVLDLDEEFGKRGPQPRSLAGRRNHRDQVWRFHRKTLSALMSPRISRHRSSVKPG